MIFKSFYGTSGFPKTVYKQFESHCIRENGNMGVIWERPGQPGGMAHDTLSHPSCHLSASGNGHLAWAPVPTPSVCAATWT